MARHATAFYTPEAVAVRLAADLSLRRPATVVDPSCGDGQLLAAVVRAYNATGLRFIGVDTNARALAACKQRLEAGGARSVSLYHGDFLSLASRIRRDASGSVYCFMNPPFIGYSRLPEKRRRRLRVSAPGLAGRFNVADAFVLTAASVLVPRRIVAILPASTGARLSENGHLPGVKAWRRLPDRTFDATISTGALIWTPTKPIGTSTSPLRSGAPRRRPSADSEVLIVRNGVATGADAVFLKIAREQLSVTGGRIVRCIRGREIARATRLGALPRIWMPMRASAAGAGMLSRPLLNRLRSRYCVLTGGKGLFEYHDAVPRWVLGQRKLIVPEICKTLRVFDDGDGQVLPLHSTLAIRTGSLRMHRRIKTILKAPDAWRQISRSREKMVGGAIRLTARTLSTFITQRLAK